MLNRTFRREETSAKEAKSQLLSQSARKAQATWIAVVLCMFLSHSLILYITCKQEDLGSIIHLVSGHLSSILVCQKQSAMLALATLRRRTHMRHKIALRPFQLWQLHGHVLQDPGSDRNMSKYQLSQLHRGDNPAVFVCFLLLARRG